LFCQAYGFTLDVSLPGEHRRMQVVVTVGFLVMLWTRLVRYSYLWYVLIAAFRADGNYFVIKMAIAPIIGGSLFNLLLVADFYRKFMKFVIVRGGKKARLSLAKSPDEADQKLANQGTLSSQESAALPTLLSSSRAAGSRMRRCKGQQSTRSSVAGGRKSQA